MLVRRWLVLALVVLAAMPAAAQAKVRVVQSASGSPGEHATLTVAVSPAATCTIEVDYKSGPSHAKGLNAKHGSRISWSWMIGTRTTPGTWPIVVSCGPAGIKHTSIRVF
jgi:micrococcal nuclease